MPNFIGVDSPGDCQLQIQGAGNFEVVQFTATYAKNEIPRATCVVATGRSARSGNRAQIHSSGSSMNQLAKAKLFFKGQMIFDGYYCGMGLQRMQGKTQAVLYLVNWLVDLTFSSTLNKDLHPTTPASMVNPLSFKAEGSGGGGGQANFLQSYAMGDIAKGQIKGDLWGGIKALLKAAANKERVSLNPPRGCIQGPGDSKKNSQALEALDRIQGQASPDLGGVERMEDAIAQAIGNEYMLSFFQTTFWEVIVLRYLPMFQLMLVPQVSRALVVPDMAYATTSGTTIRQDECDSFEFQGMLSKPLAGVGVFGAFHSQSGFEHTIASSGKGPMSMQGGFAANVGQGKGAWMSVPAPPWLAQLAMTGETAGDTSGIKDRSGEPKKAKKGPPNDVCSMYARYAKSIYLANMLQGRTATISGRFRTDVAPGSVVKVLAQPQDSGGGGDPMSVNLYGQAVRVILNVNSESAMANTTFELAAVRGEGENKEGVYGSNTHPLFSNKFTGAGLS